MTALSCNTIPLIIVEEMVEKSPYSKHHCHNCFRQLSLTDAKMQGKSMMRNRKSVSKCHLIAKNESSLTNKTLHSVSGPVILPWKTVYTHSCLVHFFKLHFQMSKAKMVYFQRRNLADTTFTKWSNITSDGQIKIMYLWYDSQHHFYIIWQKKKANPEFNHEEILDKSKLKAIKWNNWTILLKSVMSIKDQKKKKQGGGIRNFLDWKKHYN